MTLRTKTLLIIGLTLLGLVIMVALLTRSFFLSSFEELERQMTVDRIERIHRAIEREIISLDTLAHDYSAWDDTYQFVADRLAGNDAAADRYLNSNLLEITFIDDDLSLVAVIGPEDELVYAQSFDFQAGEKIPPLLSPKTLIQGHPGLREAVASDHGVSGLTLLPEQSAMVVVARPITNSSKTGPARGTLIMGRRLDPELLRETTLTPLRLEPLARSKLPEEQLQALLRPEAGPIISIAGRNQLLAYDTIADIDGRPILLLQLDLKRDMAARARASVRWIIGHLILSGLIFGVVTLLLLERTVIRRIRGLSTAVGSIADGETRLAPLVIAGNDEVSNLASAIDDTVNKLKRSQGALQYIGTHARCIIWSATVRRDKRGHYRWDLKMQDEQAAQRVLPLDISHGGSYANAWRRSRHADDLERVEATAGNAIGRGANAYKQEYRLRGKDGMIHWVWEEVAIDRVETDHWRLVGVCTDITERKQAEHQMEEARDAALEAARLKSEFLANMSHEIRTPVNGIVGMADLLMDTEVNQEQREYLSMVKESADSLLAVINDVLDFSKIEAGRLEIEARSFDLRHGVEEVMSMLSIRAHAKGLELLLKIDPDLPATVIGDQPRIKQILVNLLGNAIKFTTEGEVELEVTGEPADARQMFLVLAVRDTGIGIAADQQKTIFDAFQQADSSTTRRFGGTGLGLAISSQLAQQMHGRMWVSSEPGAGSTFHARVLVTVSGDGHAPSVSPPQRWRRRRVLVVDDNARGRQILSQMMDRWGLRPTSAADAAEARAQFEAARAGGDAFDLLLCDSALDEQEPDGFALAAQLHDAAAEPLLAMVMLIPASDLHRDAERCRRLSNARYATKPIRETELQARLVELDGALSDRGRSSAAAIPGAEAPLRVLLAEDNAINQQVAVRMLARRGHQVTVVGDGREAIDVLTSGAQRGVPFDLVLMDVQMPNLGGLEATKVIRNQLPSPVREIPIIAMTAYALRGDRDRCLDAGMSGYVAKPISPELLFDEIDRLVVRSGDGASPATPRRSSGGTGFPSNPTSVLDVEAALARLGGDRQLLVELVTLFCQQYPGSLRELTEAAASESPDQVRRIAHTLKGSVSTFAADQATGSLQALEAAGDAGDIDLINRLLPQTAEQLHLLAQTLKSLTS